MSKKISLFFLLTVVTCSFSFTQTIRNSSSGFINNTEINYSLGFSQFYGDASSSGFFKKLSGEIGFNQSIIIKKHFSPVFAVGLNGFYGCVKSHKTTAGSGAAVDFSIAGSYGDFNFRAYVDFNNLFWGRDYNRKLSVYGWLGMGYGFWSTGLYNNSSASYREVGDPVAGNTAGDTYKKGGFVMPFGLGVNYRVNNKLALNIVSDYRVVFSDDLDVWRGGSKNDNLFYLGIGVSYYIKPGFTKSKSRARKASPKQVKFEVKENKKEKEETLKNDDKPIVSEPDKKSMGEVPIFDLDYRAAKKAKEDVVDVKQDQNIDMLEIPSVAKSNMKGIVYRVQILAKSNKLQSIQYLRDTYNIIGDIVEIFQDGVYRYSSGEFTNYSDAYQHSQNIKNKGLSDAFVVVYKDGKRIQLTNKMKTH